MLATRADPRRSPTLIAELGPRARAATPDEAASAGDIVVVTIPLKNYRTVPVEPLAGKIVIDTNNYYPQRDGHIPSSTTSRRRLPELLQAHLPTSKVVKAFNHIYAAQLTTDGKPAGTPNRRALVIAGRRCRGQGDRRGCSISSASIPWTPDRSRKAGASSATRRATVRVERPRSCGKISRRRSGTRHVKR